MKIFDIARKRKKKEAEFNSLQGRMTVTGNVLLNNVKGSKVSLRKSRGDVFTRFCIDFAGKLTSFESLCGNV